MSKYDTLGRGVLTKEAVRAECFGCDAPFPTVSHRNWPVTDKQAEELADAPMPQDENISSSGRYRCAKCKNDFCSDCDL